MNLAALLLADPSPCLRWLVLSDLFQVPGDDPELLELAGLRVKDRLVTEVVSLQEPDGSWRPNTLAIGRAGGSRALMTGFALTRLGYLGFGRNFRPVEQAAEYLFSQQQVDGSWPLTEDIAITDGNREIPLAERYTMIPLQTALPLRGLASCGYATDPRSIRAYEWLMAQRLPDGAWPTGIAAGVFGGVAGYRRLPHSRWGCRSNTTAVLICLAGNPTYQHSEAAQRALDLLLGRETREEYTLGYEVARLIGIEPPRGFLTYFARFDLALILDLCGRVGADQDDERVRDLVRFVNSLQGEYGLWEYPARPQAMRWLTFDILRSISRLGASLDWISQEPRTPFRPYPKQKKRF